MRLRYLALAPLTLLAACQDSTTTSTEQAVNSTVASAETSVQDTAAPDTSNTAVRSDDPYLAAVETFYSERLRQYGGLWCEKAYMPLMRNPMQVDQDDYNQDPGKYKDLDALEAAGLATKTEGTETKMTVVKTFDYSPTQAYIDIFGEPVDREVNVCFGRKIPLKILDLSEPMQSLTGVTIQTAKVEYRVEEYNEGPMFQKTDPAIVREYLGLSLPEETKWDNLTFNVDDSNHPIVDGFTRLP